MTTPEINTAPPILQLYDPEPRITVDFVKALFSNLDSLQRTARFLQATVDIGRRPSRRNGVPYPGPVVIRQLREGSLLVEIFHDVIAPGGALTVFIIAHALNKGPEGLYKWARLPNDLRAEWYESRTKMRTARLRSRQGGVEPTHDPGSGKLQLTGSTIPEQLTGLDGQDLSLRYVEDVNSLIDDLEQSAQDLREVSMNLKVRVIDEAGEDIPDPFDGHAED